MKIGIAGAGIMGKLLAFALQNAGYAVTLFDQDDVNNCSHAAAGLLTPVTELEKNDLIIYQLGQAALTQHWPALFQQFNEEIYFQKKGTLVLSHSRDQAELSRLLQIITSKFVAANEVIYQHLNQAQLLDLEPQITKFQEGFFFPEEGQLDNQHILAVLEKNLNKITWYKNTLVQQVATKKIILNDKVMDFDMVFDCRGLGAKEIFPDLRPIRGEIMWLHAPEVTINRPIRLMHPRYSLYLAPRPGHVYLIGASEIESNDDAPITVRTALELLTAVYSIHPGFSEAKIIKTLTHRRPTLENHRPKIKYKDGLIAVNGLYRHGYLIAPALASDVMQFIQQGINAVRYPELWEKCA